MLLLFHNIAKLVQLIEILCAVFVASQLDPHSNRVQRPSYVTNLLPLSCFLLLCSLAVAVVAVATYLLSQRQSLVYKLALHMGKN